MLITITVAHDGQVEAINGSIIEKVLPMGDREKRAYPSANAWIYFKGSRTGTPIRETPQEVAAQTRPQAPTELLKQIVELREVVAYGLELITKQLRDGVPIHEA